MIVQNLAYGCDFNTFTYVCVDSSQTVLEHHRSFIPSTLVSQMDKEKPKAAAGNQTQDLLLMIMHDVWIADSQYTLCHTGSIIPMHTL